MCGIAPSVTRHETAPVENGRKVAMTAAICHGQTPFARERESSPRWRKRHLRA